MNENQEEHLKHKMTVTAACRFNASKRLQGRDRRMQLIIALASAFVIALTVMPYLYHLSALVVSDLSVITLIMSILILTISLIQYSNNDAVNAEQHHRSGLEINELKNELYAKSGNVTPHDLEEFGQKYGHILQKYSINHEDVDWYKFQLENPSIYPLGPIRRAMIYVRVLAAAYWMQALTWLLILSFAFVIIWHILPARFSS
ncbi:MAG: SLATT domain-containing protein [Hyphomicrobiales bacterium]|nr:SLATT domain-containing protein [Hyphomicrobiales bacterium]MBV8824291.1 SLATT domain-containing protein [Hyphomicrobiales bacterium]MBV9427232.1 SLATT domain-containing protein [Bradyrhizobiaceae bacterium]